MNKYLLTPDELKEIKIPYRDDDDIYSAVERIVFYSIKAQDRKSRKGILEWLQGYCGNDDHPAHYADCSRYECCDCMSELEKELR